MEGPVEQGRFGRPATTALGSLSREHAGGLRRAQELARAATDQERRAALAAFVTAWNRDMAPRLDDEERLLLPLIKDCACRRRVLAEHTELRQMAAAAELVGPQPDPEWVKRLAERLSDHLRWENEELFPALERDLTDPERMRLAEAARKIEERRQSADEQ